MFSASTSAAQGGLARMAWNMPAAAAEARRGGWRPSPPMAVRTPVAADTGRAAANHGGEAGMALRPPALLKSELLTYLNTRIAASEDEAWLHLAQKLGLSAAELSLSRDNGEPLFRSELRRAGQALIEDGLVEFRGGGQWRIVRLRDAAESPEELPSTCAPYYTDAASVNVRANKYERDRAARNLCVAHYGARCAVCDFDFERTYGPLGSGCVRVHHIVPPAMLVAGYRFDPVRDLRPICANCHYMIHRIEPAYTIEQLRALLRRQAPGEAEPSGSVPQQRHAG